MMDLIKRFSNKNAELVTKRIIDRKDLENSNLGANEFNSVLYNTAKSIYKGLLLKVDKIDKPKYDELSYFIDNIEYNEQFIVDYLKSTLWNYNERVEEELDKFWKEANDILSKIGGNF